MKQRLAALLALCALLGGCAKKTDGAPPVQSAPAAEEHSIQTPATAQEPAPPDDASVIYHFDGLEVSVPQEYADLLVIDTALEAWSSHRTPLVSFAERASVEAAQLDYPDEDWGGGWLCTVARLDRIGFEAWLSGSGIDMGEQVFARRGADVYYLISYPTDVRLYRSDMDDGDLSKITGLENWIALNDWASALPDELVAFNAIDSYDAGELFDADYTYDGEHVELGFRVHGDAMDLVLLALSQPAKQGEGGVWCVERVRYVYSDYDWTDTHLVFPVALGVDMTAADYYAQLQLECDAGEHAALLTPQGAALDYAKRNAWLFGEDVSATDFEFIEALG